MPNLASELLEALEDEQDVDSVFEKVIEIGKSLGFEYCAYGLQDPVPLSRPKILVRNNYPEEWHRRYLECMYHNIDPTVMHARRSLYPLVWSDEIFHDSREFWEEARSFGLEYGWVKGIFGPNGIRGMLALARSGDPITQAELKSKEYIMHYLVTVVHEVLANKLSPMLLEKDKKFLTDREIEILKWSADGKTSGEISEILVISVDTVNFHVKNSLAKLNVPNKTAAVVRAAMLGLLN